jgi:hypothetical protein
LGVLEQIDHLDAEATLQVLITDFPQVRQCRKRPRGLACDIEPEIVELLR